MAIEQNLYGGRKGQKRLKAVGKQIEKIKGEISNNYEDTPEMTFLEREVSWEDTAMLVFFMAFRKVHFMWNGLRDYGYLRLCSRWIKEHRLETVEPYDAVNMVKSIIPHEMCIELSQELDALELV